MFCPMCGHENPDGARFCAGCGKELPASSSRLASGSGYARPAGNAQPAPSSAAAPTANGTAGGAQQKAKIPVVAVVVAAVAVVGIVAALLLGNSGGASSVDDLADDLAAATQQVFDDGMTTSAVLSYGEALVDLMPDEVVDALLDEGGFEDMDELAEYIAENYAGADESVMDAFDGMELEILMYEGDRLDSDYIDSVNEEFQDDLGLDLEAEDAYSIEGEVTITLTEDVGTGEAGDSYTQSMGSTGFAAIEIDGRWYLWVD